MAEKPIARFFFWLISTAYGGFLGGLYFADYIPERYWWIPNAVLIAPLWICLIPLVFLFYLAFRVNSIKGVYLHCLLIGGFIFFLMDFRIPLQSPEVLYGETVTVKIVSVNAGEGVSGRSLYGYIARKEPDIVIMQELRGEARMYLEARMREEGWEYMTKRGLALATRFPVVDTDIHEHYLLGVRLDTPAGPLLVYDVHLETPRKGLEALMRKGAIGRWNMQGATKLQMYESATATSMIPRTNDIIIAGDFNLPQTNPLFKKFWGLYQNAFAEVGRGFGYTKYTSWHGVRIDHILTDKSWTVLNAEVGPNLGGDHRPIYAVVQKKVSVEQAQSAKIVAPRPDQLELPPADRIYVYEDFEDTDIRIDLATAMNSSIRFKQNQGKTLKLESGPLVIRAATIKLPPEPFDVYPKLRMAYQMLPEQPMMIRAKTQLGEWICLGATPGTECEHTQIPNFITIYNDGQWHELDINVIVEIQTLLKANKSIQAFEILIPPHTGNMNKLWFDDVLIYR